MHTPCIAVPYQDLADAAARVKPALLISISNPGEEPDDETLAIAVPGAQVFRMSYNADQSRGATWITTDHMSELLGVVMALPRDATVLAHCSAGLMRSPAVALFVRAIQAGYHTDENVPIDAITEEWLKDHPRADPHGRTLGCADSVFHSRDGLEIAVHRAMDARAEKQNPTKPQKPAKKQLYGKSVKSRIKGFRP